MENVLIVVHLMVVVALVIVVLLQRSEGGALGMGGGGGGFMTGRGQANALTRATAILAALFFATSISLTVLANWNRAPRSILQDGSAPAAPGTPAAPPLGGGNVLDDINKARQNSAPAPGEAAPAAPAPVTPAAPAVPEPPKTQ